jgi:hypothetical protein
MGAATGAAAGATGAPAGNGTAATPGVCSAPASQGNAAVKTCVASGQSWRPVVGTTEHVMPFALPRPHSAFAAWV